MKQQRNQYFDNKLKKYSPFEQTKENSQSLLDFQQEQMNQQSTNHHENLFIQSRNQKQRTSIQGPNMSTFGDAINMQKFNLFLQSTNLDPDRPKPQNKRPHTLIHTAKSQNKNLFKQNDDYIFMAFHSSPNYTLRGENNEDEGQINIRTFQSKFIRELNFRDNERLRKSRKRLQINKNSELSASQMQSRLRKTARPHIKKPMHEIWYNGIRVLSQFKNDLIHGQTHIFYPNGAKFIGRYQQGVRISGQFDFNNGYLYSGSFWGDKFQGEGTLTLPNRKMFSGDWFENQLSGKVEIKYPSGDVYYGEIKDFKKHGKGYLFFKNGQKFVGQFQNGSITGKGQYFIDEQCVGRGFWKNGELIQKVENNQQFSFFDSPSAIHSKKSITPSSSTCQRINKQSTQQTQQQKQNIQKQKQHQDFITFDDIDQQQELHIQVRSNNKMISFDQIEVNKQKSDNLLNLKDNKKRVSLKNRIIPISKEEQIDFCLNKKDKQNISQKTLSDKSQSSRRLRSQKIKKPQYKTSQVQETCDEECFQNVKITKNIQNLNTNNVQNQTVSTSNHTKASKNTHLNTSQHSQNSSAALMKTGKFNSIKSFKKSQSQFDVMIEN